MATEVTTPEHVDNNLLEVLARCNKGDDVHAGSEALRNLIEACETTGKKGTLTLTLAVVPRGENSYQVQATIKTKRPVPESKPALFFSDENHGLIRNDPNQAQLPLGEADNAINFKKAAANS